MKSAQYLEGELSLRRLLLDLQKSLGDDEWDRLSRERNVRLMQRLETQLGDISEDLEWTFDGAGVYGNKIALNRLRVLVDPLGRALRWTARDIVFMEWGAMPDRKLSEAVEPLVAGAVVGSFGLRLTRPVDDQGSLTNGYLFDEAVDRVLNAFQASVSGDSAESILSGMGGLRKFALNGIRELAREIAKSGRSSHVRWKRDTVVTITTSAAESLADILESASTDEEELIIRATLEGADIRTGHFHLIEQTTDGEKHYRGKVEPGAIARLRGLGLGSEVNATLAVVTMESRILDEPKYSYALRSFEPTDPDSLLR